jgi:LPXTG-motif cell wall-anchored protein
MGDATIGSFTWNQVGGLLLALLGFLYFQKNKNLK